MIESHPDNLLLIKHVVKAMLRSLEDEDFDDEDDGDLE